MSEDQVERCKERISMAREICLHRGENPEAIDRNGNMRWEMYEPLAGAVIREAERLFAARAAIAAMGEPQAERFEEALWRIAQWSKAYPLTVFPEPDLVKAAELLKAGGITLDALSAHAMRHVVEGVGKIAAEALEGRAAVTA